MLAAIRVSRNCLGETYSGFKESVADSDALAGRNSWQAEHYRWEVAESLLNLFER